MLFDAPRTHHGLEELNGDHGEDELIRKGGLEKLEDARNTHKEVSSSLEKVSNSLELPKVPFDPLKKPLGPMTRARAKRFKEALLSLIGVHLEELKAIGVHLKLIGEHHQRNIPINSKLCTLLEIDEY